jgi:acyl-coenzyme A synthetase/AMP-(fatty) acid ligase
MANKGKLEPLLSHSNHAGMESCDESVSSISINRGAPPMKETRDRNRKLAKGVAPLVAACQHTLQKNGCIVGTQVATAILPRFPTFASAFPTQLCRQLNKSSEKKLFALASIDGRRPIDHVRVRDFVVHTFGPTLHAVGLGRGNRVAVILPNGPELALAILCVANWASCVPLNATSSKQELLSDLRQCRADVILGPYGSAIDDSLFQCQPADAMFPTCGGLTDVADYDDVVAHSSLDEQGKLYHVLPKSSNDDDFASFYHIQEIAQELGIPFVGIRKSRSEAGIFEMVSSTGAEILRQQRSPAVDLWSCGAFPPPPVTKVPSLVTEDEATVDASQDSSVASSNDEIPSNDANHDPAAAGGQAVQMSSSSRLVQTTETSMADAALNACLYCVRPLPGQDTASDRSTPTTTTASRFDMNQHDDEVLVLFTSGTTGSKKLVPHCLGDMLVASATIALSWNLTPRHINCNLMPLFHVGGIVRQVFAPVVSGGSVICCPSFDPQVFWSLLQNKAFTWYYAAPTMHHMILQTGKETSNGTTLIESVNPHLHMIANAAGGLLPSLAVELREVFKANVLPSYGMTECMPISSPPASYQLEKTGTSGVPVGPEVAILNMASGQRVAPGVEGPIW